MLNPYYVTGFVDGEGCFCVSFSPKRSFKTGWEVRPSFSLSQDKKSRDILFKLKEFFGCGEIRPSKRDNTYKYEVRSLDNLIEKIIPHFEKYPLQTSKRKDYIIFKKVVFLMREKKHLSVEGIKEIAHILQKAPQTGKRIYDLKQFSELVKV